MMSVLRNLKVQGLLTFCWVMLSGIGLAQESIASGEEVVQYTIRKPDIIRPGQEFQISVLFTVQPEWYIYAPTGINAAQGMIETSVVFTLPEGITRAGRMKLPKPQFKNGREVYEGKDIVMSQALRTADDLKPGQYQIKGKITWQTCNSDICLPPQTDEFDISIEVTNAGSETGQLAGWILDLKFTALDGREVDVSALQGKVVLIDCWATWCIPCLKEIPHIKELYQKYHAKGFEVIGISMDGLQAKGRVEKIIRQKGIPWPQRFEGKGFESDPFREQYDIRSLPTVYLLDKQGNIVDTNARGERLEPMIRKYLGL